MYDLDIQNKHHFVHVEYILKPVSHIKVFKTDKNKCMIFVFELLLYDQYL